MKMIFIRVWSFLHFLVYQTLETFLICSKRSVFRRHTKRFSHIVENFVISSHVLFQLLFCFWSKIYSKQSFIYIQFRISNTQKHTIIQILFIKDCPKRASCPKIIWKSSLEWHQDYPKIALCPKMIWISSLAQHQTFFLTFSILESSPHIP